MHHHPSSRRVVRVLAVVLAASAVAAPTASAKTFVSNITDVAGDADKASTDIVKARVAYNRRTGALSAQVTMKGTIDGKGDDAIVSVVVSSIKNGKCQKSTLMILSGIFSLPGGAVASPMKGGKQYPGTSSVSGKRMALRTSNKVFSGKTPGCAYVVLMRNDAARAKIDQTKGNDGFS